MTELVTTNSPVVMEIHVNKEPFATIRKSRGKWEAWFPGPFGGPPVLLSLPNLELIVEWMREQEKK